MSPRFQNRDCIAHLWTRGPSYASLQKTFFLRRVGGRNSWWLLVVEINVMAAKMLTSRQVHFTGGRGCKRLHKWNNFFTRNGGKQKKNWNLNNKNKSGCKRLHKWNNYLTRNGGQKKLLEIENKKFDFQGDHWPDPSNKSKWRDTLLSAIPKTRKISITRDGKR